jgi:hypothetical protein
MTRNLAQVGTIPGLMGGSAYKGSLCYKRSAGLQTPNGASVEHMGVDHDTSPIAMAQ